MKLSLQTIVVALAGLLGLGATAYAQRPGMPSHGGSYPAYQATYQPAEGMAPELVAPPMAGGNMPMQAPPEAYGEYGGQYGGEGCYGGEGGYGCDDGCGYMPRVFATAEYLNWWVQGRSVPALVTTSPLGTPQDDAGVLGEPTTTVLLGDGRIDDGDKSGYRFTAGLWLDDCQMLAWGGSFWKLDPSTESFSFNSPTNPGTGLVETILARPYFNTFLNRQDASLIAFSDTATPLPISEGNINVTSNFQVENAETYFMLLWGRDCLGPDRGYRVDLLGGYRYSRLKDSLAIDSFSTSLDPTSLTPVGTTTSVNDTFRTENEFHGGEIGVTGEYYRGPWTFTVLGKFGVGNMHQTAQVSGQTVIVTPNPGGSTSTIEQGLLALDSNIGTYSQNRCVVVPELNLNAAIRATEHIDFTIGYSLVYWNLVATAGNQIDLNVNPTLLTPLPSPPFDTPSFQFRNQELWVQGLSLGMNVRW